jgi:hypothetical protein
MRVMTTGVPDRRRRNVCLSSPDVNSAPVDQLSRAVDIFHRVIQTLPTTVTEPEELIAPLRFVTHISSVLLTLTDLLSTSAHRFDRTQLRHAVGVIAADLPPTAAVLLGGLILRLSGSYGSCESVTWSCSSIGIGSWSEEYRFTFRRRSS